MASKKVQYDQMIELLLDKNATNIISTLIAKMESLTFDEGRTCVFRTSWGKRLFSTCAEHMLGSQKFDIDEWFRSHVPHSAKVRRDIDPSMYRQPIDTDWLTCLLELELMFVAAGNMRGSLLQILHNLLELEDSAHAKLSKYCKTEVQYNFQGISQVSSPAAEGYKKLLMPAPAPPPKPGSMDDLLSKKS